MYAQPPAEWHTCRRRLVSFRVRCSYASMMFCPSALEFSIYFHNFVSQNVPSYNPSSIFYSISKRKRCVSLQSGSLWSANLHDYTFMIQLSNFITIDSTLNQQQSKPIRSKLLVESPRQIKINNLPFSSSHSKQLFSTRFLRWNSLSLQLLQT